MKGANAREYAIITCIINDAITYTESISLRVDKLNVANSILLD